MYRLSARLLTSHPVAKAMTLMLNMPISMKVIVAQLKSISFSPLLYRFSGYCDGVIASMFMPIEIKSNILDNDCQEKLGITVSCIVFANF